MATSAYLPMVSNSRLNGGRSQTQYPLTAAQTREANNAYNMAKASTPRYRVAAPPPPARNTYNTYMPIVGNIPSRPPTPSQYFPLVLNNPPRTEPTNPLFFPLVMSNQNPTDPRYFPTVTAPASPVVPAPVVPAPVATTSAQRRYYPTSVYGGSGGGGGSSKAYEQYGITSPWMDAYKSVWGKELSPKLYGLVNPVTSLFTRYMNRLPQLEDWNMIWAAAKQYYANNEIKADQMPLRLEVYEPLIAAMRRQPLFTPPTISYAPQLSF